MRLVAVSVREAFASLVSTAAHVLAAIARVETHCGIGSGHAFGRLSHRNGQAFRRRHLHCNTNCGGHHGVGTGHDPAVAAVWLELRWTVAHDHGGRRDDKAIVVSADSVAISDG